MKITRQLVMGLFVALMLASTLVRAQNAPPPFRQEELEAMLAPIALYPDALLSQVLMASTYPLEVVQAARWSRSHSGKQGDAAVRAVENEPWDVSVKSLVAFPNVLIMMNDKLDWTQNLGDAFLGQQGDVMDAVQSLRMRAQNSGNLTSTPQQAVSTQGSTIIIEQAQPQVVYVPAYNPTVVYGAWPYTAYPPTYYPGVMNWYPGQAMVSGFMFGVGIAAAGAMFGGFNWGHRDVNININRVTNIDRNYNRNAGSNWQHNPQHRGAVSYRDQGSRQRYDKRVGGAEARRDVRGFNGGGSRENMADRSATRNQVADRSAPRNQAVDRAATTNRMPDRSTNRNQAVDRTAASNRMPDRSVAPDQTAVQSRQRPNAFAGAGGSKQAVDRGRASTATANRGGGGHQAAAGGGGANRMSAGGGASRASAGAGANRASSGGGASRGNAGGGGGRAGGGRGNR